jgi:uncharacterized protein with FMN-binding domain
MKSWRRVALIITLSAVLGMGALRWYDRAVPGRVAAGSGAGQFAGGTTTVATAPPPPRPASGGRYADGTYTGSTVYAYYGYVQVRAVVSGGKLEKVVLVRVPDHSGTSRYINGIAGPYLASEAVAVQSGNVDVISGATLTSEAFAQSLDSALAKAG